MPDTSSLSCAHDNMNYFRDTGCDEGALTWDSLQTLLCRAGESMTLNNIDNDLTSLLGVGEEKLDGSTPFGYQSFAEDILGFAS